MDYQCDRNSKRPLAKSFRLAFVAIIAMLGLGAPAVLANVSVSVQPPSLVVPVGSNVVLTAFVSASAGETIKGYSWRMSTNSQGPFNIILGVAGPVLSLPNVQVAASGFYVVALTYDSGTNKNVALVSSAAALVVHDQARIVGQPLSLSRITGDSASFSVAALGQGPLSFQWRHNGLNLADDGRINGAGTATLTLTNLVLEDAGSYDVLVTNLYAIATSAVATLSVLAPPTFPVPLADVGVIVGSNAVISATVAGSAPFGYQWFRNGLRLSDSGRISGSGSDTLSISTTITNDAGDLKLIVTNAVGGVTSRIAHLSILVPPVITSPTNATGKQGFLLSYTITATGTTPMTFGATNLPDGLSVDQDTGELSGVPSVFGVFNVTLFATNAALASPGTLVLDLASDVPGIISPLTAQAKQGQPFNYTIAASNNPVFFSADGLPPGLFLDPTNGVISGSPLVSGAIPVTIGASNIYGGDSQTLTISSDSSVPVINSPLSATGIQGQQFNYSITASNPVVSFAASGLPPGLNLNSGSGIISGPSILSGTFSIAITAINQFGSDTETLTLDLASVLPVFTNALDASAFEAQPFSFALGATNALNLTNIYAASGLPVGLSLSNGVIVGTPLYSGLFPVLISAADPYGATTNTLRINVAYATNSAIYIDPNTVKFTPGTPYLLDFAFSLRNDPDGSVGDAIVRPTSDFTVTCFESGVTLPSEAQPILLHDNKKQFKGFLVLDYTYSMLAARDAISNMQYSAELLINLEPPTAQFGVYEFHADYATPQLVTNFTSDKTVLTRAIEGIQTNFVRGNYAGTRAFDAMYAALGQFSNTNTDESRYLIVMSDGNDDSSLLNTNANPTSLIIKRAQQNGVRLYCVAFGPGVDTNTLQLLASQTQGRYYEAGTGADLPVQFSRIAKDIDGQYLLRWATLRRAGIPFQPSFQLTIDGVTAAYNTNLVFMTNEVYMTNIDINTGSNVVSTNYVGTNVLQLPYNPTNYAGDVRVGAMRLVPDADVGAQIVRLRAAYVPRYVREIRLNYRPNYPCTATLASNGSNDFLFGWSISQTNDGAGGQWLTILSPNPDDLLSSLPYGIMGDLVSFQFHDPEKLGTNQAFSVFTMDNSIYTNMLPTGQSFVLSNAPAFITLLPPPPPHGTPIPWLNAYGFTNNLAAAELTSPNGNGLAVWQDYLAGLNPRDTNSTFAIRSLSLPQPGLPHQVTFNTVLGRTYRVDTATSLDTWAVLDDYIPGTGGDVMVLDTRDLSGVINVFYRVVVR